MPVLCVFLFSVLAAERQRSWCSRISASAGTCTCTSNQGLPSRKQSDPRPDFLVRP